MAGSCPYANALGVPGQGVHATRLFGLAVYDVIATILVAAVTTWITGIPFYKTLLGWFVIGEVLHYMFGTQTAFLKAIGFTPKC